MRFGYHSTSTTNCDGDEDDHNNYDDCDYEVPPPHSRHETLKSIWASSGHPPAMTSNGGLELYVRLAGPARGDPHDDASQSHE